MELIEERGPIQLQVWVVTEHLCTWCRQAIKGAIALFTLDGRAPLAMLCEDCLRSMADRLHSHNGKTERAAVPTKELVLGNLSRGLKRTIEKRAKQVVAEHARAKLDEGKVRGMRQKWANGERSMKTLARMFQCSESNVYMVVHNRTWRHVKIAP